MIDKNIDTLMKSADHPTIMENDGVGWHGSTSELVRDDEPKASYLDV